MRKAKYDRIAVNAARIAAGGSGMSPVDAWEAAALEAYPHSKDSREKSCPKSAFLGLAEEGFIVGIEPGDYITPRRKSQPNKEHALDAIHKIMGNPAAIDDPQSLWFSLPGVRRKPKNKQHNGQMDVVISLWSAGLIDH